MKELNKNDESKDSTLISREYIQSLFEDIRLESEPVLKIKDLFINNLFQTIESHNDDQLSLIKTMVLMVNGSHNRSLCLRENNLGGNEKRQELAKIIGLISAGNDPRLRCGIERPQESSEFSEIFDNILLCNNKEKSYLKNSCIKSVANIVEIIYENLDSPSKVGWISTIGKTPEELFLNLREQEEEKKKSKKRKNEIANEDIPSNSPEALTTSNLKTSKMKRVSFQLE